MFVALTRNGSLVARANKTGPRICRRAGPNLARSLPARPARADGLLVIDCAATKRLRVSGCAFGFERGGDHVFAAGWRSASSVERAMFRFTVS